MKSLKEKGDLIDLTVLSWLVISKTLFPRALRWGELNSILRCKTVPKQSFYEPKTEPFEEGPTENQSCLTNQAINKMCG